MNTTTSHRNAPFAEATMAEHFRWWLKLERHRNALTNQILDYFGLADAELLARELRVPFHDLPNLHRGLRRTLRHWKLDFEGGEPSDYSRILWSPRRRKVQVAPGKSQTFITAGSQFFKLPDGSKRVLVFAESWDPHEAHCLIICPRADKLSLRRDLAGLANWMRRNNPLRGRALRADATYLDLRQSVSWDQIALPPETRTKIWENTVGILNRREVYRANGVPQRRGLLLYGPPGTGKTMVGKALAADSGATFIWVTAADMSSIQCTRQIFRLARKLRPTILFLEDLDMYASDRNYGSCVALGELLCQMDGLEKNDGLVIVATTNDIAAIEPALSERPSRFDIVLEIGLPEATARRQILAENLQRQSPTGELLDAGAAATTGLSGAQVREVAVLMIQGAIARGAVGESHVAQPTREDLDTAIARVTGRVRKAPVGFHAGIENAP